MRGGAIFLDYSQNVRLEKNQFIGSAAEQGGAVYIYHSEVDVKNNHFEDC